MRNHFKLYKRPSTNLKICEKIRKEVKIIRKIFILTTCIIFFGLLIFMPWFGDEDILYIHIKIFHNHFENFSKILEFFSIQYCTIIVLRPQLVVGL